MLTLDEERTLVRDLIGSAEVMGQAMSPSAAAIMVADLEGVPLLVVRHALRAIRSTYKGRLTFPVIRERILEQDGRPGREEAWMMALESTCERSSVAWTAEVQLAIEVARPAMRIGDKVAARMAFLSAYDRFLLAAREAQTPCEWTLSMGWDADGRVAALDSAVRLGRIPADRALAIKRDIGVSAITDGGRAIVALLTGPSSEKMLTLITDEKTRSALLADNDRGGQSAGMSQDTRARLAVLGSQLRESAKANQGKRQAAIDLAAKQFTEKKNEIGRLVLERLASGAALDN